MKIRTLQWNIGGGKILHQDADPTLLKSYTEDGLDEIISFLRKQNPDIITLQETHAKDGHNQPQQIAEALGYDGWVNDEWDDSHVEAGQRIGQGIVCRFPVQEHSFEWFTNPHFEAVWEDGSIAKSHDKGRTRCMVVLEPEHTFLVQTLHTVPIRRFKIGIDSDQAVRVRADMASKLVTQETGIIQADFNLNIPHVLAMFPTLAEAGFEEVPLKDVTTPKGELYDHILYKGIRVLSSMVVPTVKTDHYPVVTDFETI